MRQIAIADVESEMLARSVCAGLLAVAGLSISAAAQDTRTVTEPHLPPVCATLTAQIAAPGGVIAAEDETRLDTARIQQAMDRCTTGEGVYLRADGAKDVFLSGPLTLRSGVTLVVDAQTALVGSRDPRVYDLTPESCGIVSTKGHGCKPLILGDGVENSGIMGEGSIDGRGGATLLGQKATWWDLAHEAKVTDRNQSVPW
ncbi:MAG: glycoside hydrolase, partial [Acidobacteriota bacterium]|nr:glycoside hydrolase [Acidobacteriota bacterium]